MVQRLRLHASNAGGKVRSLVRDLAPTCCNKEIMPQLKILRAAIKDPTSCSKDRRSPMAQSRPGTANNKQRNKCFSVKRQCYPEYINTLTTQQKPKNPIPKWAMDLKRYFSPKDKQMATEHRQRWSTSLVTKEKQIKPTIRYYEYSLRWLLSIFRILQVLTKMWSNWNPGALVVSMKYGAAAVENGLVVLQNVKNTITI